MASYSFGIQVKVRRFALVLLVFGALSVSSARKGKHEEEADNEPSQSDFVRAGTNADHVGNHGKYFQDFYSLQYGPNQLEFGHVCEDPSTWEQRFERKDVDKNRHQGQKTSTRRVRRYGHQDKDHYDMGHRRGNEHHFIERHEKGSPHHGHVSTKVRWGDKHGGYGEHYWDFNHAGHHDGGDGDGTAPVAEYVEANDQAPQNQQFQNSGTQLAPTATATQTRLSQQSKHSSPSHGLSMPEFTFSINPVKLPKAQVSSASQLNEKMAEGRLPSSWSPIPSLHPSPTSHKPLTSHQLSRARRSLRLPTRLFERAGNSVETRKMA